MESVTSVQMMALSRQSGFPVRCAPAEAGPARPKVTIATALRSAIMVRFITLFPLPILWPANSAGLSRYNLPKPSTAADGHERRQCRGQTDARAQAPLTGRNL